MVRFSYSFRWLFVLCMFSFLPLASITAQVNEDLRWRQWDEGINATQASGKFMLVDVYTTWCGWCKKMNRTVFGHPQIQQLLAEGFIPVKLNAESSNLITNGLNQCTEQEMAKQMEVNSFPTILIYNSQFQLVSRLNGYKEPDIFIRYLKYIRGRHYTEYSFKEYLKRVRDDK
jgi:thioredoxin-related protein